MRKVSSFNTRQWCFKLVLWVMPATLLFLLWSHIEERNVAAAELRTAVIKCGEFVRTIRISGSTEAVRAYVVQAPRLAISANLFTTISAPGFCAFGTTLPVRFGFPSTLVAFG